MRKNIFFLFLAAFVFSTIGCDFTASKKSTNQQKTILTMDAQTRTWEDDYTSSGLKLVSASSIIALDGDISGVTPTIDPSKVPGLTPEEYLDNDSCLGYYGPIGPYGPLGTLGPIGDDAWDLGYWISGTGTWGDHEDDITGPLGPDGPLGETGPVAYDQYFGLADPGMTLFATNDFAVHTRAFGLWSVLGPIGPLGALGPLGPLGPVGSHGCDTDTNGSYICGGTLERNITTWYDQAQTTQRTYGLYEHYTESYAKSMTDNDTSFMVSGEISISSETDVYEFTSAQNQVVTILLVPEKQLDDFDLEIVDQNDNVIATSNAYTYIDWIQLKVPAGTKLKARVWLAGSYHWLSSTYRLFVTGSTQYINKTNVAGSHVLQWHNGNPPKETPTGAQTIISEDFDAGFDHWTTSELYSGISMWKHYSAGGDYYMATKPYPSRIASTVYWNAVSPPVDLVGFSTITLKLTHKFRPFQYPTSLEGYDYARVYALPDYMTIGSSKMTFYDDTDGKVVTTIDLSQYAGETNFRLKFSMKKGPKEDSIRHQGWTIYKAELIGE